MLPCMITLPQIIQRTHHRHAEPCGQQLPHKARLRLPVFPGKMQLRMLFNNHICTKPCTDTLRSNRCDRRTAHPQSKRTHEQKIQTNIQYTAEQKQSKRQHTVSDRLQHRRFQIVGHRERNAGPGSLSDTAARHPASPPVPAASRAAACGSLKIQPSAAGSVSHRKRHHPARSLPHFFLIPSAKAPADRQCHSIIQSKCKIHDQTV